MSSELWELPELSEAPKIILPQSEILTSWPFPDKPPREVQIEALTASQGKKGFAFFMRQRLGKTLTAYAEYKMLQAKGEVKWMVIICNNSLKEQWKEAIEEVDPFEPIHVYNSQRKANLEYFFQAAKKTGGVLIINYDSAKSLMDNEVWSKFDPLSTYLVADESTKIKAPFLKSTKACLDLASICEYKRVLTAKPSGNSNNDLWSQLKFIGATGRNYHQHQFTFTRMGGWQGRQAIANINEDQLKSEIAPYCYIAPDKYITGFKRTYEPLRRIELPKALKDMYLNMYHGFVVELDDEKEISAPIVLTKYLRLQQISSGIAGDENGTQHNIIDPKYNMRIKGVRDILENEIRDSKTIIACRFKLSIKNLYDELSKDYKVAVITGGMDKEIPAIKEKFNESDTDILIGQCNVLAYGHTLTGPDSRPCTNMIHYERNFSLLDQSQIECRPEKFGRDLEVSHYDFFVTDMDKYILKALIRKEDAATSLMGYAREHGILNSGEL